SLFFTLLLVIFATDIVQSMGYEGKEHFVYVFAAILALDAVLAIPFAKLRLQGKAKTFASAKFLSIFFNIAINVFFLYFCENIHKGKFLVLLQPFIDQLYNPALKVEYIFIANLVANLSMLLVLYKVFSGMSLQIDKGLFSRMFTFGYPVLFTGLALVTNEMLSRWALKYWLPDGYYENFNNQQILGIFSGVYKLAILLNLGIQAFRYAAEPFFFSKSKQKDSPLLFANVMDWFVIFGCFLMLGVGINLDVLQYLLRNPDYRTALHIVPVLLLANLFMGINYNLSAWYKLVDYTKAGTYITLIGAGITIVSNWFLIPLYGYTGCAASSVLAYFSMCVISYLWSRKYNAIPWHVLKISLHIIIAFSLTLLINNFPIANHVYGFIFHNTFLIIYLGGVLWVEKRSFKDL
ncbi:MAG: polysaccharide biosynthesis C-terminal domain-containing protein, partial [Cyclobacteriaceae bacterium]|nr:polysaccharide biosynthesis C-terminal domain-containing protein [Cyclobacteriaceae bacterium]